MTALLIFSIKILITLVAIPFAASMAYGAIRGAKSKLDSQGHD